MKRTPLALLISGAILVGISGPAAATNYSVDFSKSLGVFHAENGRNDGFNCRAANVEIKPKWVKISAEGVNDCGRMSSEGVGVFYEGKYRTTVKHKKTAGVWYGDMIMFVNGPSKTCQLCNGEIDPLEYVFSDGVGRWNWRIHSVYEGTTKRCSSGETFSADVTSQFAKVGVNIKPDKVTFWKGKKKIGTVTRASHTAVRPNGKRCTWPFNAVGGSIKGMRMVFSAKLGGFGGTPTAASQAVSKVKNLIVKNFKK